VTDAAQSRQRHVFLSYARRDKDTVAALVEGLKLLGADVWLDRAVIGGQAWWDTILAHIREANVVVQAVSPASVGSEACDRERAYAVELGKPVIPVLVEPVPVESLPLDLTSLQVVDYTGSTTADAFRLAGALAACPPEEPLPDPLPEPPPIPVSYLTRLGQLVRAPSLSLDEQLALVARLRTAAEHPEERELALEMLERLAGRDDLYQAAARDIELFERGAEPAAKPAVHRAARREPAPGPAPAEPGPTQGRWRIDPADWLKVWAPAAVAVLVVLIVLADTLLAEVGYVPRELARFGAMGAALAAGLAYGCTRVGGLNGRVLFVLAAACIGAVGGAAGLLSDSYYHNGAQIVAQFALVGLFAGLGGALATRTVWVVAAGAAAGAVGSALGALLSMNDYLWHYILEGDWFPTTSKFLEFHAPSALLAAALTAVVIAGWLGSGRAGRD
jgi:hypothetical protein